MQHAALGWREYYPGALEAFDDLHHDDALAILGRAPTPLRAANLSLSKIRSALKAAGRQRNLDTRAQHIQAALRTEQLAAPAAYAATTRATVGIIADIYRSLQRLHSHPATRSGLFWLGRVGTRTPVITRHWNTAAAFT